MSSDTAGKFTTVTESSGYRYRLGDRGGATLVGVRCPRCDHVWNPTVLTETPTCPACGFREDSIRGSKP